MLESQSEKGSSDLIFRAPPFRVQKGLKVGFMERKPASRATKPSKAAIALALGYRYLKAVETGKVQDFAGLARMLKVSRARVSMTVELTLLAPRIQSDVVNESRRHVPIQGLVRTARLGSWAEQVDYWERHGSHPRDASTSST